MVRVDYERCVSADHEIVRPFKSLDSADKFRQPFEGKVCCDYRIQVAILVIKRFRICGHHHLATAVIIVWFAPVWFIQKLRDLVPVHVMVVIGLISQLLRLDLAVFIPI